MKGSSLPYFEVKAESGKILKILIDTGSSKNYVKPELARKRIPNEVPFYAKSVVGCIKICEHTKTKMNHVVNSYRNLFSEPDEKLTYTTKVVAQIRTTSDSAVYTKFYPYPAALKGEVENQVKKLLNDGIIRPSRSLFKI